MSESESEKVPRPVRRTAGVVLGGLAAGALIGAATAQPALAAEAAPAAAQTAPADVAPVAGPSVGEQFRAAFSAGIADPGGPEPFIVVSGW
jgi:hypothetical protein